ncbi:MAG: hypothetical protein H0W90_08985 [Actinobacteria bacterium]|nr:hypothetical protein [Actinomycetota bacterium]
MVLALIAALAVAAPASSEAPTKALSSYCSPSGDVCFGIFKRAGKVSLEITTAAKYFKRYTLCVRRVRPLGGGAESAQRCGSFPVFRQGGGTWGSRVNYVRQYPVKSPGRYRVTWKLGATALGPALYFRLPLP